jgi:hypothetical protein
MPLFAHQKLGHCDLYFDWNYKPKLANLVIISIFLFWDHILLCCMLFFGGDYDPCKQHLLAFRKVGHCKLRNKHNLRQNRHIEPPLKALLAHFDIWRNIFFSYSIFSCAVTSRSGELIIYTESSGVHLSTCTLYNFSETIGLIDFIFFKKLLWKVPKFSVLFK